MIELDGALTTSLIENLIISLGFDYDEDAIIDEVLTYQLK